MNQNTLAAIGLVFGVICLITYCTGYNVGRLETRRPARIQMEKVLESEITALREQLIGIDERYESQISALQQKQTSDISALERRQSTALNTLGRDQATAITNLNAKNSTEVTRIKEDYTTELIRTRDSSFLGGQVDARTNVQNEIDQRVKRNISRGRWNDTVFTVR